MNMHLQGGVAKDDVRPNAGIDVSKHHLDVCCSGDEWRVSNDAHGWDGLTAKFRATKVDLVVVEATGGYERGLVCALQGAGVCVARVNPRQSRDFAKSMGVLDEAATRRKPRCCGCVEVKMPPRPSSEGYS